MAVLTDIGCLHVQRALARSVCAIVTTCTVARDIRVVKCRGSPGNCCVAVVAVVPACDMGRMFAGRDDTIMAGAATAKHLSVVDGICRRPYSRRMTVFADIGRQSMCRVLACGIRAVMAVDAVTRVIHMIEVRRQPGYARMTVVTVIAAAYVGRVLAGRRHAIVTGATGTNHLCVIDGKGGHPGARRVAAVAVAGTRYMSRVLACCRNAVMARTATAQNLRVVDRDRRYEHRCAVAVFADVGGRHVRRTLACRTRAVVTTHAISNNPGVIKAGRNPAGRYVAVITLITG